MKTSIGGRAALSAALAVAVALLVAACGGNGTSAAGSGCQTVTESVPTSTARTSASWPYSNADLANTRDAAGSTISSANVSRLEHAWTFKLTGKATAGVRPYGSLTSNPIVQNGVAYVQDLDSNVYALALATGKLEWEYRCNQPERSGPGPNGVAVADGRVYGLTPTAAFALGATTGRTIWVNSDLLRRGQGTFGIQPQVAGGRVYLASQYGSGPGGGVLLALNASSAKRLRKAHTRIPSTRAAHRSSTSDRLAMADLRPYANRIATPTLVAPATCRSNTADKLRSARPPMVARDDSVIAE